MHEGRAKPPPQKLLARSRRQMSERAALSLLLRAILQWGRGWKRGEGRGGYCTTLSQGDPPHRGLPKLAQPSVPRVLPAPLPAAPTGVHAHRGMLGTPHPAVPSVPQGIC